MNVWINTCDGYACIESEKGSSHVELFELNNMQIFYVVFIFLNYS